MAFRKSVIFLMVSCLILLTACSKEPAAETGAAAPSASTPASKPPAKKTTIRLGTWEATANSLAALNEIVDAFNKVHPEIEVKIESSPEQYTTKVLTQIAGGDAPDIITSSIDDLRRFYEAGATTNLSEYFANDSEISEDIYYEDILGVSKFNNEVHFLPKDWSNLGVYYNKKLFDDAGVPYPEAGWTWEQFYETAKKLTVSKGDKIVQWGAMTRGADKYTAEVLAYAYGGTMISEDGLHIEGYMNSPQVAQALQLYRDMYYGDKIMPSPSDTSALQGIDLFGAQRVAMKVDGRWPVQQYNESGLNYGTVTLPVGPAGPANTLFYAGYAIYSKSPNKEAAWQFLKYLAGPEGSKVMSQNAFSAIKQVADEVGHSSDPIFKGFLDSIPYTKPNPININYHYSVSGLTEIKTVLEMITLPDNLDIQTTLNKAAKSAQEKLEKAIKNNS